MGLARQHLLKKTIYNHSATQRLSGYCILLDDFQILTNRLRTTFDIFGP
jgi:hypothetical protein